MRARATLFLSDPRKRWSNPLLLSIAALASLVLASPASAATCLPIERAEQRQRADVIVKGVFRTGDDGAGVLLSPASFRAFEYRKGDGPRIFDVETATHRDGESFVTNSGGIAPKAGERWLLAGKFSRAGVFRPNICLGSERRRAAPPS